MAQRRKRRPKQKRPIPSDDDTILMCYVCPEETAIKIASFIGAGNITFIQPTSFAIKKSAYCYDVFSGMQTENTYECNPHLVGSGIKVRYTSKVSPSAYLAQVKVKHEDKAATDLVTVKICINKTDGLPPKDYEKACWMYLTVGTPDPYLPLNKQKDDKDALDLRPKEEELCAQLPLMTAIADAGMSKGGIVSTRADIPKHFEVIIHSPPTFQSYLVKKNELGRSDVHCAMKVVGKHVHIFIQGALSGWMKVVIGSHKKKSRVNKSKEAAKAVPPHR